jgi:hypothetical protein
VSRFIYNYAKCNYAECHYAECRYAECHYAECRGATKTNSRLGCKFYKRVIVQNKMNLLMNIFFEFTRTLQHLKITQISNYLQN